MKTIIKSKHLVLEAILRYYDLLSFVELTAKSTKSIGHAKQKLIFYLAYVKSDWSMSSID